MIASARICCKTSQSIRVVLIVTQQLRPFLDRNFASSSRFTGVHQLACLTSYKTQSEQILQSGRHLITPES